LETPKTDRADAAQETSSLPPEAGRQQFVWVVKKGTDAAGCAVFSITCDVNRRVGECGNFCALNRKTLLAIVDVGLPDGDGCELMTTLRSDHGLGGVALTGNGMEDDVKRCRRAGFDHHFLKPIDMPKFNASIGQLLSGPLADR
jgi:CheY-like chemotaxis protein